MNQRKKPFLKLPYISEETWMNGILTYCMLLFMFFAAATMDSLDFRHFSIDDVFPPFYFIFVVFVPIPIYFYKWWHSSDRALFISGYVKSHGFARFFHLLMYAIIWLYFLQVRFITFAVLGLGYFMLNNGTNLSTAYIFLVMILFSVGIWVFFDLFQISGNDRIELWRFIKLTLYELLLFLGFVLVLVAIF